MKKIALLFILPIFLLAQDLQQPITLDLKDKKDLLEIRPDHTTYKYMSSGFTSITSGFEGVIAPNVGFGIRGKFKHFGHDCSLNLGVVTTSGFDFAVPFVSAKGQVLYYFSEKPESLFVGISGEGIFMPTEPVVIPYGEFLVGVEWKKKSEKNSFITLGINPIPLFIDIRFPPILTLNYGFSF